MMNDILKMLRAYIFPKGCACCLKPLDPLDESYLCDECKKTFVSDLIKRSLENKVTCYSYCKYGGAAREAIINLKFNRFCFAAKPLGDKLALVYEVSLKHRPCENTVLLPVPIAKRREIKRGFNQSELIARRLSENLGIKVIDNAVKKTKNTSAQSLSRSADERKENVKGVYQIKNAEAIKGKDVVVIDDVITTGSTLKELTDIILPYARSVVCLTVASAEIDNDN